MPAQVYQSTLAKRLGQKVVAAQNETRDKPLEMGFRDLPPDVRNGVAQLSSCYIGVHAMDVKSEHLRGQEYFTAFGIAKSPKETPKGPVEGLRTKFSVELVDEPKKGNKEAVSFIENWNEFQGFFMRFGIPPAPVTATTAEAIMAYYQAAMKSLADRKPHFGFKTRGWTPPALPGKPAPTEMTFHEWFEECSFNGTADPGAGVTVSTAAMQPEPFTEPPQAHSNGQATAPVGASAATPVGSEAPVDPADEIVQLVEIIMADPNRMGESISDAAAEASGRLVELAKAQGATDEQIAAAKDYDVIGEMALGVFNEPEAAAAPSTPTVGQKAKFCKRTSAGEKLADAKKVPFPAQDVEVVSVDAANKTVTAKTVKDGKPVVDLKKNVVQIKFEWLE